MKEVLGYPRMKKSDRPNARVSENARCRTPRQGIARGEKAVDEGHVLTHAQARKRLARWLKSPAAKRRVTAESEAGCYFASRGARATPGSAKAILAKAGKRTRL